MSKRRLVSIEFSNLKVINDSDKNIFSEAVEEKILMEVRENQCAILTTQVT